MATRAVSGTRVDELREEFARDPEQLRSRIAMLMGEVAEASCGLWYRFGLIDGEPYPVEWAIHGLPEWTVERQSAQRIPWPAGDPRLPDRAWNGRFVAMGGIVPREQLFRTKLYQVCYAGAGIHDQLRMMLYHQGRHVAWIGALRTRGEPSFGRTELRRLRELARPVADALVHADATARAASAEEGADLVLDARGRVELGSPSAASILAHPEREAMLASWVRAVDRGEIPPRVLLGMRVRWCRLTGDGATHHLLHLEPVESMRVRPDFELSRTQRSVAEYAAAGARVVEIAEALGIAPTTVRTHLHAVYASLGVASRAELANVLRVPDEREGRTEHERVGGAMPRLSWPSPR